MSGLPNVSVSSAATSGVKGDAGNSSITDYGGGIGTSAELARLQFIFGGSINNGGQGGQQTSSFLPQSFSDINPNAPVNTNWIWLVGIGVLAWVLFKH